MEFAFSLRNLAFVNVSVGPYTRFVLFAGIGASLGGSGFLSHRGGIVCLPLIGCLDGLTVEVLCGGSGFCCRFGAAFWGSQGGSFFTDKANSFQQLVTLRPDKFCNHGLKLQDTAEVPFRGHVLQKVLDPIFGAAMKHVFVEIASANNDMLEGLAAAHSV